MKRDFLRRYDQFTGNLQAIADMPGRTVNLLFRLLRQTGGHLSRGRRDGEFKELTDEETERIEHLYAEFFEPPLETGSSS